MIPNKSQEIKYEQRIWRDSLGNQLGLKSIWNMSINEDKFNHSKEINYVQ